MMDRVWMGIAGLVLLAACPPETADWTHTPTEREDRTDARELEACLVVEGESVVDFGAMPSGVRLEEVQRTFRVRNTCTTAVPAPQVGVSQASVFWVRPPLGARVLAGGAVDYTVSTGSLLPAGAHRGAIVSLLTGRQLAEAHVLAEEGRLEVAGPVPGRVAAAPGCAYEVEVPLEHVGTLPVELTSVDLEGHEDWSVRATPPFPWTVGPGEGDEHQLFLRVEAGESESSRTAALSWTSTLPVPELLPAEIEAVPGALRVEVFWMGDVVPLPMEPVPESIQASTRAVEVPFEYDAEAQTVHLSVGADTPVSVLFEPVCL